MAGQRPILVGMSDVRPLFQALITINSRKFSKEQNICVNLKYLSEEILISKLPCKLICHFEDVMVTLKIQLKMIRKFPVNNWVI